MSAIDHSPAGRLPAAGRTRRARPGRSRTLALFGGPGAVWLALFILIPYAGILVFSFWRTDFANLIPAFTLDNLHRALTDEVVRNVLLRTLWIALAVTAVTFVVAFPLAYLGAFYVKRKRLFVFLVVAPMWVSYIVRLYSWRLLLGSDGVLNKALIGAGVIDHPLEFLLFSPWAVILTLSYVYLPFMFISLFSVLDGIDKSLMRAAGDLYAAPARRFARVTIPLSKPGIAAGVMMVFPLAFGDYIAPGLVGGTGGQMFANLVQNQFGTTFNYPFGAALAVVLLAIVMAVLWLLERWRRVEDVRVF